MMLKLFFILACVASLTLFPADAQDSDLCPGQNEFYNTCISGCSNQSCATIGKIFHCPIQTTVCKTGCQCKPNFYRNSDDICVSEIECKPISSSSPAPPVIINNTTSTTEKTPSTDSSDTKNGLENLKIGINAFTGIFLYYRMKSNQGENIITSPYSIFDILGQTTLSADGNSLEQLLRVLNVFNKQDIRNWFPALVATIDDQNSVDFSTAAKVYSNIQYPLSDDFKKDSVDVFHADAQELDFSKSDEASNAINSWVESKTNNRIKDLIAPSDLSSFTRLLLVDAIYFKGDWLHSFDKANTKDADFYLADGTTKKTKLMYQEAQFKYGEDSDLDCKILEMPYKGKNFSMVIVLPNQKDGILKTTEALQSVKKFNTVLGSMYSIKVQVYLPPFEINTTTDLEGILKEVGVTKIFDQNDSGLSGILRTPENIYVSKAIQKAFIKVDETGTEAAAANAVVVNTLSSIQPIRRFIFRADRSFLYYIVVKGIPVLCGAIVNP